MDFGGKTLKFTKIVNFEDKTLIFFPAKAEMLLFSNLNKGGHQVGQGGRYYTLKFRLDFHTNKNIFEFQIKIASSCPP